MIIESLCIYLSVYYLLSLIDVSGIIQTHTSIPFSAWLFLLGTMTIHGLIVLPYVVPRLYTLNSKFSSLKGG